MNRIELTGNVTKDPDIHVTQGGVKRASFTLAVNRKYANAQGNREADFIPCIAWREKAEFVEKYVTKGKKLGVVGSLQFRSYDAQDGSKRTVAEVIIDDLEFLSPKEKTPEAVFGKDKIEMMPADDDPDLPY